MSEYFLIIRHLYGSDNGTSNIDNILVNFGKIINILIDSLVAMIGGNELIVVLRPILRATKIEHMTIYSY